MSLSPLQLEVRCTNNLLWGSMLSIDIPISKLSLALISQLHCRDQSINEKLIHLKQTSGDQILIVSKTRRLQLRLSYLNPPERRVLRALQLWGEIRTLCDQIISKPSST